MSEESGNSGSRVGSSIVLGTAYLKFAVSLADLSQMTVDDFSSICLELVGDFSNSCCE